MIYKFITVLAWFGGPASWLFFVICVIGRYTVEESPYETARTESCIRIYAIVGILCAAWLLARYKL